MLDRRHDASGEGRTGLIAAVRYFNARLMVYLSLVIRVTASLGAPGGQDQREGTPAEILSPAAVIAAPPELTMNFRATEILLQTRLLL